MTAIGIVAHTSREAQAIRLATRIGAMVIVDDGTLGCEANHHRLWKRMSDISTYTGWTGWVVILEDDAQPVDDFRYQLDMALSATPTPIVSLYLGRQRPPHWQPAIHAATDRADQQDACYITATHLLHAVGVAIHTNLIPDMLTHTATYQGPWDYAIGAWAQQAGHTIAYTWPSLVDHADGETIAKHPDKMRRTPGRKAWRTGTRHTWTPTTVTMHQ